MSFATNRAVQKGVTALNAETRGGGHDNTAPGADDAAAINQFIRQSHADISRITAGPAHLSTPAASPAPAGGLSGQQEVSAASNTAVPDGKIGDFSQGHIGDCFVLTALNATSQTAAGRQIIQNSITSKNGVYYVKFAGDPSHTTYTVTQAELKRAQTAGRTSTGDPDVPIFEIAISKYEHAHGMDIQGGNTGQVLHLLTGMSVVGTVDHDYINGMKLIQWAAANPAGFILTLGSGVNKATGQPVNHETDPTSSPGHHAFTVTSIDEKTGMATLENPWDTTKTYTLSLEQLAGIGKLFLVKTPGIP